MSTAPVADRSRTPAALDAARAAWLAAAPTAVITVVAVLVLGPPLGATLLKTPHLNFWPTDRPLVRPEPTEHARFLIALTAPLLLMALLAAIVHRPPRRLAQSAPQLARAIELTAVLAAVGCFVVQRTKPGQSFIAPGRIVVYFTLPTVVAAVAIGVAIATAVRSASVRDRFARWTAESWPRAAAAVLVAVAMVAITMLPAILTDASTPDAGEVVRFHLLFTYDETMAVVDGRSPLGTFAAQYASLLPYLAAGVMGLLGRALVVFTMTMAVLTALSLLAVFAVLRRVTGRTVPALLLFLPLMATSAFRLHGDALHHFSLVNYFGVLPLRYFGPFVLLWLLTRHLDGARPRRAWPLFLTAGLVVLNNTDFGLAALGATVVGLLFAEPRLRAPRVRWLALEASAGLIAAFALVTALLLARTGSPPHLSMLFTYARVYAVAGYAMLPMRPPVGMSTVIFLTYVAAIGVASVRVANREPERLTTALLAWSGIFGLGTGAYYVGHSLSELLTYCFPCWALTVVLLTVVVLRGLAARPERLPTPSACACLFAFGLLVCSLAQTPAPWEQAQRLAQRGGAPIFAKPTGQSFVARHTRRGEPVIVFTILGHRLAANLGVRDVEFVTGSHSIHTTEQLADMVRTLRDAGGRKLFLLTDETVDEQIEALSHDFKLVAEELTDRMQLWVLRR
jgi:hypothetical protein